MFDCENCARLTYSETLEGQNPDEYSVPVCSFYDKELRINLQNFFTTGYTFINCEECVKDKYEHYMKNADHRKQRGRTAPNRATTKSDSICKYRKDKFCVNADCPCCADFCPVSQDNYMSLCKYGEDNSNS